MPGTLLLDDWQNAVTEGLQQFGKNALQAIAPAVQNVAAPVTQVDPNGIAQRLQNFGSQQIQNLNQTQPLQAITPGVQDISQRLQDFGTKQLQNLEPVQNVQAPSVSAPSFAGVPPPGAETGGGSLQDYARQAAQRFGIDPDLFVRQIQQESGFNPKAGSPAGAQGIAQFMPATAAGLGVDTSDPYSSLDGAARLMANYVKQYGGDYAKALAAYNAGPGNVEKYGGVPPFEETQRYVSTILGGAKEAIGGAVQGAQQAVSNVLPAISQFGDKQLSAAEAYAACGPAAAVRFAQMMGRNPTLREAVDLAKSVGWTQDQGMAGLQSESKLFDQMGVAHRVLGADWQAFAREAQSGNPVTLSTPGHYFTADAYDPASGAFHVGQSGLDLRGGSEWMTPAQMEQRMGALQGGLVADHPSTPSASPLSSPPSGSAAAPPTPAAAPRQPNVLFSGFDEKVNQGAQMLTNVAGQGLHILDQSVQSIARPSPVSDAVGSAVTDFARNGPIGAANALMRNAGTAIAGSDVNAWRRENVPNITEPNHPFNVMSDLNNKYQGLNPERMTPEDQQRYANAAFAFAGMTGSVEPRTPITAGGLGTPRYNAAAGTPEATISQTLRDAAAASPDGVAHLDANEMGQLPGLPTVNAPPLKSGPNKGQPNWQYGAAQALDHVRAAIDNGLPQSRWYSEFARNVANVVGHDNINEFAALFGITSARNTVDINLAQSLGLMRMARDFREGGLDFTLPNMKAWFAENPILKQDGTPGKWAITEDKLNKIQDLYTTGVVDVPSNAKTASYAQNIISALRNHFDPNSTLDTWMNQLFNYRDTSKAASQDEAYRAMRAVMDHLSGELGMLPHQAQAAAWFSIKAIKEFANSAGAPAAVKAAVRDFENGGKTTLGDLLDLGKQYGVYDAPAGTWSDVANTPAVAHQLQQLTPESMARAAPESAQGYLQYPGKLEPQTGNVAFPVNPLATAERRGVAEAQAPVVSGGITDSARTALGYDPNTRQFDALGSVPHEVQGNHVLVPGGNMDTLRYVASRIGAASGDGAQPATLYHFDPDMPDVVGWRIRDIPQVARGQLVRDLNAAGIGHQILPDGTIRVNALPVADAAYEQSLAQAVQTAGAKVRTINGIVQEISPEEYQSTLSQYGGRYGAPGQPGLPEPGSGVSGPTGTAGGAQGFTATRAGPDAGSDLGRAGGEAMAGPAAALAGVAGAGALGLAALSQRDQDQGFTAPGGPVGQAFSGLGSAVTDFAQNGPIGAVSAAERQIGPALADRLGPSLSNAGEAIRGAPVVGGLVQAYQSPQRQQLLPNITDPEHPFNVMADLNQKYGTSLPSDQMTPEDRARAENASVFVGGMAGSVGIEQAVLRNLRDAGLVPGVRAAAAARGPIARGVEATKQFMLSGPPGMIANVIGNTIELGRQPVALTLGGRPRDALAGVTAVGRALPEAARNAWSSIGGQQLASLSEQASGIPRSAPFYRILSASDQFTRTLGEYQGMASEANRLLNQAGIKASDPAAANFLAQHAADLYHAGAREGAASVFGQIQNVAAGRTGLDRLFHRYSTFKEGMLASPRLRDQALGGLMDYAIPFSGIPVRMLEIAANRLPGSAQAMGAVRAVRAARAGDIAGMQREIGNTALESMIQALIAKHIADGNITGPNDPAHPSAVRIAGNWVDMRELGGYTLPMQIMASFAEGAEKGGQNVPAGTPGATPLQQFVNYYGPRAQGAFNASMKTFVKAVPGANLLDIFANIGQGNATSAGLNVAQDLVNRVTAPGMARFLENAIDPVARDVDRKGVESLWQGPLSNWPGLAQYVPAKIDPSTGEVLQKAKSGLGTLVGVQQDVESPLRAEIMNLRQQGFTDLPPLKDYPQTVTIAGREIELSPDEQRAVTRITGGALAQMSSALNNPDYQNATPQAKAQLLQILIRQADSLRESAALQVVPTAELTQKMQAGQRIVGQLQPAPAATPEKVQGRPPTQPLPTPVRR